MLVNFFLCLVQLGFCCVYVLFVADNLYRVNELTIFLLVLVLFHFSCTPFACGNYVLILNFLDTKTVLYSS